MRVGGLVGYNEDTVAQCYSMGTVSGDRNVGGLVGYNKNIVAQCYSMGTVSGTSPVGGLVGHNYEGDVSQCLWDTQTSSQTTSAGGTGKATAEMQTIITFLNAGWDFVDETMNGPNDIWKMWDGYDYPRLAWEPGPNTPLVFVDIPSGTFQMGDHYGVGRNDEGPVHTVTLDGFQMSKYETTHAQYAQYLNAAMADGLIQVIDGVVFASSDANLVELYCHTYSADSYSHIEYSQGQFTVRSQDGKAMSDHPVGQVYWYGAKAFCNYYGYRLPTEAEWEYVARGGYHDPYYRYPWGTNTIDCTKANFRSDTGWCNPLNLTDASYTSPVGYYGPQGAYGLCDMSGNVWEWCQDWYDKNYYSVSPMVNPTGPTSGLFHVLRGGSWSSIDSFCRVAFRHEIDPDLRYANYNGFRVCR
jgi:formylglycine-generating enzyme required for sulfatase activity